MNKTTKRARQGLFLCSILASILFLLGSVVSVLADQDSDDAANYGVRGNRITSTCTFVGNTLVLPQVPPPPTLTNPPPCNGKVVTLDKSPSSRWSLDISWFDPATQNLYLADRNNFGVDIFDTRKEKAIGLAGGFVGIQPTYTPPKGDAVDLPVANNSGPNGDLVINNGKIHQLWAGDGVVCAPSGKIDSAGVPVIVCSGTSHVQVFDLDKNGLPKSTLPFASVDTTGVRRADELAYDPDDQLVLVANDDDLDLFVSFIKVSNVAGDIKVVGKIPIPEALGCGIEQPVYNHSSNRFYLAVPCTTGHPNGAIYVIDPKKMTVENVYDTVGTGPAAGVPCFPHGLTLGPRQDLLLGCSGDAPTGTQMISIIMKATNGKVLKTFTQAGGSDEVWYNPGDNKYYLAMSSWTSTGKTGTGNPTPSLGIIDAGTSDKGREAPEWIQNILTTRTSHSVAAGFGFACDDDDHGKAFGKDKHGKGCGDIVRQHAYVPLTTIPIPLSSTATINETGGIGIIGREP